MKFTFKAEDAGRDITLTFEGSYLPDILVELDSFLRGCGFFPGEASLEFVSWEEDEKREWPYEDDKAGQDIVAAYDVLFSAACDKTKSQQHLINLCASIIEIAEDTMKQADYEAQLGK